MAGVESTEGGIRDTEGVGGAGCTNIEVVRDVGDAEDQDTTDLAEMVREPETAEFCDVSTCQR